MSVSMEVANGKVTVRFLASLKEVFREKEVSVDLEQARNVDELLHAVCTTPEQTRTIYAQSGSVRSDITVLVNGRNAAFLARWDTALHEGDLITVFLPTAGG